MAQPLLALTLSIVLIVVVHLLFSILAVRVPLVYPAAVLLGCGLYLSLVRKH